MSDIWNQFDYFPSTVYKLDKPEFLEKTKEISYCYLDEVKKNIQLDELYPTYQTQNFADDKRLLDFVSYISQTSWNILSSQGYKMETKETYVREMWLHHYYRFGSMDQHTHSDEIYISGFYILDADEKSSQIVLHDPRPGKVQMGFFSELNENIYNASNAVYFKPEPGMLLFINSWLPHSFTRNASTNPFSFIHFNLGVREYISPPPPAEVI